MAALVVNCDGLCEPENPGGTACYGWVAYRGREKIGEGYGVVCSGPEATNNVAEYTAVIKALEWLLKNGFAGEEIEVRSDSQLAMYQLQGFYAVRSPRILPLYQKVVSLARKFKKVKFRWVPRELNEEADALSRRAYASFRADQPDPVRLRKARELAPLVVDVGDDVYVVPSQSGEGDYFVDLLEGTCTCTDYKVRKHKCKHILAAEIFAAEVKRKKA